MTAIVVDFSHVDDSVGLHGPYTWTLISKQETTESE